MEKSTISFDKCRILSGSALKLIAVITMLIDHFALIFIRTLDFLTVPMFSVFGRSITAYFILRRIGRIAFPLFCFLIAEGFYYTKNRKKYMLTLFAFALISEIPFNCMLSGFSAKIFYFSKQNVYFTLFFGVLLLYILESKISNLYKYILAVLTVLAVPFLRLDYGISGVLLIALLYLLRRSRLWQVVCAYPFLSGGRAAYGGLLLTVFYNGERGFIKGKALKYAFYVFYPLHIMVLLIIRRLIG